MLNQSIRLQPIHMSTVSDKRSIPIGLKFLFGLLLMAVAAVLLMLIMREKGYYLSGYDDGIYGLRF